MGPLKRIWQKWRTKTSARNDERKAATEPLPVVPPGPAPSPEVTEPPVTSNDRRVWGCVDCKRYDVTLYNINFHGWKRKACQKHKGRYPKYRKGSLGFQ